MEGRKSKKSLYEQYIPEEVLDTVENTTTSRTIPLGIYPVCRESLPIYFPHIPPAEQRQNPTGHPHTVRIRKLEAYVRFNPGPLSRTAAVAGVTAGGVYLPQYWSDVFTVAIVRCPRRPFGTYPASRLMLFPDYVGTHVGDAPWAREAFTGEDFKRRMEVLAIQNVHISDVGWNKDIHIPRSTDTGYAQWKSLPFKTTEQNGGVNTGIEVYYPEIFYEGLTTRWNFIEDPNDAMKEVHLVVECDYTEEIDDSTSIPNTFLNNDYLLLVTGTHAQTGISATVMNAFYGAYTNLRTSFDPY